MVSPQGPLRLSSMRHLREKKRLVHDALQNSQWITDIVVDTFTVQHQAQYIALWDLLQDIVLSPGIEHSIIWTLTTSGTYTTASAYKAQFLGSVPCSFDKLVWKTWVTPKCKFFSWLAVQNRLWTSDRLAKRGWPHQPRCQLCMCHDEMARYILFVCRYSRRIWWDAASWLCCPSPLQCIGDGRPTVLQYWEAATQAPSACPKGLKTAVTLITWELWKERNARVFNNRFAMLAILMQKIKDEGKNWILAGAKHLEEITS